MTPFDWMVRDAAYREREAQRARFWFYMRGVIYCVLIIVAALVMW